jgi:hypothetical protein
MKSALIVTVISGALVLSSSLPRPVLEAAPLDVSAPAPEAAFDSTPCSSRDGSLLAIGNGCCQRRGGLCRCRDGKPTCCDGTVGSGCSCRGDSPMPDAISSEAPS